MKKAGVWILVNVLVGGGVLICRKKKWGIKYKMDEMFKSVE